MEEEGDKGGEGEGGEEKKVGKKNWKKVRDGVNYVIRRIWVRGIGFGVGVRVEIGIGGLV